MGQLYDRDAWASRLPTDGAADVVSALDQWVAEEEYDLYHRGWFDTGRSNAPVAKVLREAGDDGEHLVLKFSDTSDRVVNLRRGWTASVGYREAHLARTEPATLRLGETWRAVFMRIAGGDLDRLQPLTSQRETPLFPSQCASIARSIVADWNGGLAARDSTTVGAFVNATLGRRRTDAEAWAVSVGVAVGGSAGTVHLDGWLDPLPNPFQLLSGEEAGRTLVDVIIGKAHGDLSGRNIVLPTKPRVDASAYVLIDYDRFSDRAPLARDPMHLLVALALDDFDALGSSLRPGLARVLVDPDVQGISGDLGHFRRISKAIHTSAAELAVAKGSGDSWRQHCLLSLVGAGIVHLGRKLYTDDAEAAKNWCLQLAAMATEEYLGNSTTPAHGTAPQQDLTSNIDTAPTDPRNSQGEEGDSATFGPGTDGPVGHGTATAIDPGQPAKLRTSTERWAGPHRRADQAPGDERGIDQAPAQRFADELRRVYEAAGKPPLKELVQQAARQLPPVKVSDSGVSDWFNGRTVPSDPAVVKFLATYLGSIAVRRRHQVHGLDWWEKLRAAAWAEKHTNRGGRAASQIPDGGTPPARLGKPIRAYSPLDLEVHRAIEVPEHDAQLPLLPSYLTRAHDRRLREKVDAAASGISQLAVLVGGSSTGKTRACWEAVHLLPSRWSLWHPIDPSRPHAQCRVA